MPDLNDLQKHREALLLAEVAAWLHDYRKCSDEQLQAQSRQPPPNASGLPRNEIEQRFPQLQSANVSLINEIAQILDLLRWDHRQTRQQFQTIGKYLVRCHHTAHFDKQEPPEGEGEQDHRTVYLSSPFGYESDKTRVPTDLTTRLFSSIPWLKLTNFQTSDRADFVGSLKKLFSVCGADTRRPINEITLWDWGYTVGSLYKAALAGALLGFQPQARDLRWRLLSVRFDGLAFFAEGHRLPDVLATRQLLNEALDNIRELLEITYPLGTEVYRDENGSVFVATGCEKSNCSLNLLALQDGAKTLCEHIFAGFWSRLEGELVPTIEIDKEPWWGQDPDWEQKQQQGQPSADELPPVSDHLLPVPALSDPNWVDEQWNTSGEICTVCGLRPQGPSSKAQERKVCDVCERRRADRSKEWATQNLHTTIWTDEMADTNGRIALLVAQFDLTPWLDGTFVQTLTVVDPGTASHKTADALGKNPSFARLRRIWETTRRFWQGVTPTDEDGDLGASLTGKTVEKAGPRLEIRGTLQPKRPGDTLGPYHACELVLPGGVKLSVVWDAGERRFITADNMDYVAKPEQLGRPAQDLLTGGQALTVEEPVGYGAKNKEWGTITLTSDATEIPNSTYTPAIPILAEPRTFMALVPADHALNVVRAVKTKYEREMGKVRNRLPLTLGIVYAGRRTPLRAVLDAGRRMLNQKALGPLDEWRVTGDVVKQTGPLPNNDLADGTHQFDQWYAVQLHHQALNRSLTWYVPAVMGDGNTEDQWYPYVFWVQDKDGNADPSQATQRRSRYFQAPHPFKPVSPPRVGEGDTAGIVAVKPVSPPRRGEGSGERSCWLVHAGELKQDDVVHFTPATLDWVWLEAAGRRFEIAYDEPGRRLGLPRRPYLLDELETLDYIWQTLSPHLTTTQIHALHDLVEFKREEWCIEPDDETFRQFCRDAVANAGWRGTPWGDDRAGWLDAWADHAARGRLADVVELYMQIMKQEPQ